MSRIEHDGELLGVLVHDPAVEAEDPGLVEAVGNAAALALENEALAAQVRRSSKMCGVPRADRRRSRCGTPARRARPARRSPAASRRPRDPAPGRKETSEGLRTSSMRRPRSSRSRSARYAAWREASTDDPHGGRARRGPGRPGRASAAAGHGPGARPAVRTRGRGHRLLRRRRGADECRSPRGGNGGACDGRG